MFFLFFFFFAKKFSYLFILSAVKMVGAECVAAIVSTRIVSIETAIFVATEFIMIFVCILSIDFIFQ